MKGVHGVECNPNEFATSLSSLEDFAAQLWSHFSTHKTTIMIMIEVKRVISVITGVLRSFNLAVPVSAPTTGPR